MDVGEAVLNRRSEQDRRQFSWRTVFFGFMRSRRRDLRRGEDGEVLFLDWHHPWLFFLAVGTMLLSCTDAFMTLQLLERGMYEVNPLMAAMLRQSTSVFAVSKVLVTGVGLMVLVYLAKARFMNRLRVGAFLTMIFSGYACLVCYEFVQLMQSL